MDLRTPFRWLGRRDDSKKAAEQDNALIDTPEHSDVVEDDDHGRVGGVHRAALDDDSARLATVPPLTHRLTRSSPRRGA
jgi:hypothetical protein